jgi:hypothetical protein
VKKKTQAPQNSVVRKADEPAIDRPSIGIQIFNRFLWFQSTTSARDGEYKKTAIAKADDPDIDVIGK